MRDRLCVKQLANRTRGKSDFLLSSKVLVLLICLVSMKYQCVLGEMTNPEGSPGKGSTATEFSVQSPALKFEMEFEQTNRTMPEGTSIPKPEMEHQNMLKSSLDINNSTVALDHESSMENSLVPDGEYVQSHFTPSPLGIPAMSLSSESIETDEDESAADVAFVNEVKNEYDVAETSAKSLLPLLQPAYEEIEESETSAKSLLPLIQNAYQNDEDNEHGHNVTPTPRASYTIEPKSMLTSHSVPLISASSFTTWMPPSTTPRTRKHKNPHLHKMSNILVTASSISSTKRPRTTSKRPKKVVTFFTTKRPKLELATTTHRAFIPQHSPEEDKDPHHPHGVVVFDKRKKRPKPSRHRPRPVQTAALTTARTTTTTTSTTTTTTPPTPVADTDDYYDYFNSGESSEEVSKNSTREQEKVPLSKLAMAMIASSTVFDNGTGSEEAEYPKLPVNLLNILQSYTKQVQMTTEGSVQPTVVQIQSTPFMVQLNKLPFGTRIAISVYYSLIAIIPLIYLAFGGLGRMGLLSAFSGRTFGIHRRVKRNVLDNLRSTFNQRSDLNTGDDEESIWILKRIAHIMQEFSPGSSSERRLMNEYIFDRN